MNRPEECSNCKYWDTDRLPNYPFRGICNALAATYYGWRDMIDYQDNYDNYQKKFVTNYNFYCNHYEEYTPPPITTCPFCEAEGVFSDITPQGTKRYTCPILVCPVESFIERKGDEKLFGEKDGI